MGMFDEVRCLYPLPVAGANTLRYQTKDTERQELDLYEIREDGTLWREEYDVEDQSDPTAEGFGRFAGMLTRVNHRWIPANESGQIFFYTFANEPHDGWIEWRALFDEGKLVKPPELVRHDPGTAGEP